MPSLAAVKAANAQYAPSYIPTAVFVGGNSGIGQAMAEAFAKQTKGRANIVIIARNKVSADKVIAGFPSPPPASETNGVVIRHEFIACDASVMKNVHDTTQELLRRLDKINILVTSVGGLAFSRVDTADGVDASLALRYYARAKFIEELTPLLSKAKAAGEDAKAMTILMAAGGAAVNLDDLDLDKKWSMSLAANASGSYNDVMIKVNLPLPLGQTQRLTIAPRSKPSAIPTSHSCTSIQESLTLQLCGSIGL
jgi:NAD(P)-dependent dehydrogenase (short-subunit alcohol dehydrogenase family)